MPARRPTRQDPTGMAAVLKNLGFIVLHGHDLPKSVLEKKINIPPAKAIISLSTITVRFTESS
jgi:hypothetical protein